MIPAQIADKHLQLWFQDGVSIPGDGKPTLRERVEDAITEALDTIDDKYLASELKRIEGDRDSWMEAYLRRGEELRAMIEKMKRQVETNRRRTESFKAEELVTGFIHMVTTNSWDKDQMVRILEASICEIIDERDSARNELRAMTQARDDATAAHIITAERLQRVEDELKVAKELLGVV
jgi:hypothetical protein